MKEGIHGEQFNVCLIDSLSPCQQFFSYVGMGLPKQGLMCLAQGHNTVTPVRFEHKTP